MVNHSISFSVALQQLREILINIVNIQLFKHKAHFIQR